MNLRKFIATAAFCAATLLGSAQNADSMKCGDIYLAIDNVHFFKDNEFKGNHVKGYTLPGFTLTPRIVWQWTENVALEAGAHWIHYWGSDSYPHGAYLGLAEYDTNGKAMHVVPWLRAEVNFGNRWQLVFGSLGSGKSHKLPEPLWDSELPYSADPEAGLQLTHSGRLIDLDVWCDWRNFIYHKSPYQEVFVFGSSVVTKLSKPESKLQLSVPLHFIALHNGGEILAQRIQAKNNFNAAAGLTADIDLGSIVGGSYAQISLLATGYHQHGNDSIPYTLGYGLYPSLTLGINSLSLKTAWWRGDKFNSLLGEQMFSNMSESEPGLFFDRYDMVVSTLSYDAYIARGSRLTLEATLFWNLAARATDATGTVVNLPAATSFTFGAVLHLSPRLKIK